MSETTQPSNPNVPPVPAGSKFCFACGNAVVATASICPKCGSPIAGQGQTSRLVYILLAIFLGLFGIHNFYAGRYGSGIAQLLINMVLMPILGLITLGIALAVIVPVMMLWVLIEICVVTTDGKGRPFV
jgi:TM2 domain-containing membrane protein YozV